MLRDELVMPRNVRLTLRGAGRRLVPILAHIARTLLIMRAHLAIRARACIAALHRLRTVALPRLLVLTLLRLRIGAQAKQRENEQPG